MLGIAVFDIHLQFSKIIEGFIIDKHNDVTITKKLYSYSTKLIRPSRCFHVFTKKFVRENKSSGCLETKKSDFFLFS